MNEVSNDTLTNDTPITDTAASEAQADGVQPDDAQAGNKRKKRLIIIGIIIVVALIVAAVLFFLLPKTSGPKIDPSATTYSIPGYTNADGAETGRMRVPTYSTWTMAAGTDYVGVPLINMEGNPCYFQFVVKLKDTDEVLYQSELVPPGKAIPDFHLNRTLDAGTYPITVAIKGASLDDPTQALNGAEVGTTLEVS